MAKDFPYLSLIFLSLATGLSLGIYLPALFFRGFFFPINYEHSVYLLKNTLMPLLLSFPLSLFFGLFFAILVSLSPKQNILTNFFLISGKFLALFFPLHFALVFLLFFEKINLNFYDILILSYFLFLFFYVFTVFTYSFQNLKRHVYKAGISFGASYLKSLLFLVLPYVFPSALAKILRHCAFLVVEVYVALLIFSEADFIFKIPAGPLLFLSENQLNGQSFITILLVLMNLQLYLWGISLLLDYLAKNNRFAYVG